MRTGGLDELVGEVLTTHNTILLVWLPTARTSNRERDRDTSIFYLYTYTHTCINFTPKIRGASPPTLVSNPPRGWINPLTHHLGRASVSSGCSNGGYSIRDPFCNDRTHGKTWFSLNLLHFRDWILIFTLKSFDLRSYAETIEFRRPNASTIMGFDTQS